MIDTIIILISECPACGLMHSLTMVSERPNQPEFVDYGAECPTTRRWLEFTVPTRNPRSYADDESDGQPE